MATLRSHGTTLLYGNGGSAADAQHRAAVLCPEAERQPGLG